MQCRLWDGLFFEQSRNWTKAKVSNLNCDETPQIARWFLLGVDLGSKPLFDGLCSCCATLLFGHYNDSSAGTNWKPAPPIDRFGEKLVRPDGKSDTNAQPPCFLRYSPRLFAEETRALCFSHVRLNLQCCRFRGSARHVRVGRVDQQAIHESRKRRTLDLPFAAS